MAANIAKRFQKTTVLLDQMIYNLENQLGKPHSASPFAKFYSTSNTAAPSKEEEKKQEVAPQSK